MSELLPQLVQDLHDRWLAEKVVAGDDDPGFPGPDGNLYYSDDHDFWSQVEDEENAGP